jgi:hypothetical protein
MKLPVTGYQLPVGLRMETQSTHSAFAGAAAHLYW